MTSAQDFLNQCVADDCIIKFPDVQLDLTVYEEVKATLEAVQGKWKRGKGFIFPYPVKPILELIQSGRRPSWRKEYAFFPTPQGLAHELLQWADIQPNETILEPSAGMGAIVDNVPERFRSQITCVEINPLCCEVLENKGYNVINTDFLTWETDQQFDKIIANPPFNKSIDIDHVRKMFSLLKSGGRLVTITGCGWTYGDIPRKKREFRDWINNWDDGSKDVFDIEPGAFKSSQTMVPSKMVIIDKY